MMKYTAGLSLLLILCFGCGGPAKEENKNNVSASVATPGQKYSIDTKESVVAWKGSGPMGSHTGYVYISQGELMLENSQLTGGTAEVDMRTIEGDDHRSDNNLIDHLKDHDFFDVKNFPITTIVITKVASVNRKDTEITANLTIKDITHVVTFPANIEVKDGIVNATGMLVIDRTLWNVRYNSEKFFDNLKDQAISDSIEFDIKIVAKSN